MKFGSYLEFLLYKLSSYQEEVVLKRCWLARYWGLATKYGKLLSGLAAPFSSFGGWIMASLLGMTNKSF